MPISFRERLAALAEKHLIRERYTRQGTQGATISWERSNADLGALTTSDGRDGTSLVNVSSNDYLGLAHHPALQSGAITAMASHGNGAGASRLLSGNFALLDELENAVARWLGFEKALWFSSGYLANIGLVPALAEEGDHIFSDALNHASTIDGCRLSKATLHIYPHRDVAALERALQHCPNTGHKFILSESVFSMDGDIADVAKLRELADQHDAFLVLDEAHALGCYGPQGTGIARAQGVTPDVIIGTFGKALGSQGAFVAASQDVISWLWNRARSHVFATAPHPAVVGSCLAAIQLMPTPEAAARRANLRRHIDRFGAASAIVPWIIGAEADALAMAKKLADAGYWAQAVRPPTVAPGTSRVRLVLSAAHSDEQIETLRALCQRYGFAQK